MYWDYALRGIVQCDCVRIVFCFLKKNVSICFCATGLVQKHFRCLLTTSSSDSSLPWMLLLSLTACWCLLPLVWLNRCTSEVIYKHTGRRWVTGKQFQRKPGGKEIPISSTTTASSSQYVSIFFSILLQFLDNKTIVTTKSPPQSKI